MLKVLKFGGSSLADAAHFKNVKDIIDQDESRKVVVRGEIKQWNQLLAETAHDAGVITDKEFAVFQNAGYVGLYGGLDVENIHERKRLEIGQKILDIIKRIINWIL